MSELWGCLVARCKGGNSPTGEGYQDFYQEFTVSGSGKWYGGDADLWSDQVSKTADLAARAVNLSGWYGEPRTLPPFRATLFTSLEPEGKDFLRQLYFRMGPDVYVEAFVKKWQEEFPEPLSLPRNAYWDF